MTSLAVWTGADSRGPTSLNIASDSRIGWTTDRSVLYHWDHGKKIFASSAAPLIVGYAHLGDADGTARALDEVDDAYEARNHDSTEPEWTYWLTRDEITVMAARCWTRLGQPGKAAPLLADVFTLYGPDQVREQALYWSFLAEAHLNAGQRAEAADTLRTASSYAALTRSARVDARITMLRRALNTTRT